MLALGTGSEVAALARAGVRTLPRLTAPALTRALADAEVVIVAGVDDDESLRLAHAVAHAAGTAPLPSATLFDEPAAARAWRQRGYHAVSRTDALALAALRAVPPWPGDRAAPPPVVVGDTPLAGAIVRRIAIGWQQPGERIGIHRVVRHRTHATPLLDEDVDEASDPHDILEAIGRRREAWPEPPETHATVTGPTIYVADADDPLALGGLLAAHLTDARVVVVADAAAGRPTLGLTVLSRQEYLADPAVLLLTDDALLAEEVFAEAAHWPADLPSLFGVLARDAAGRLLPFAAQPDAVRRGVGAVAGLADDLLRDLGILLGEPEPWPGFETLVPRSSATDASAPRPAPVSLTPAELSAAADRLVHAMPAPDGVDVAEHRQRAIELAARLPVLLARAGRRPRRPPEHRDPLADLPVWAPNVHAQYRLTVRRTAATGHDNAERCWEELSPFEQASSRAQLADIPAKLAAVGLDCRPAADPDAPLFVFAEDLVERLAVLEHRRWAHVQRRHGRPDHRFVVHWDDLAESDKDLDRDAVRAIPHLLRFVGLDVFDPDADAAAAPRGTTAADQRDPRLS